MMNLGHGVTLNVYVKENDDKQFYASVMFITLQKAVEVKSKPFSTYLSAQYAGHQIRDNILEDYNEFMKSKEVL